MVLDPWNGSGTTTLAAQMAGMPSVGVDLNPVANIVAHLRANIAPASLLTSPPNADICAEDDPLLAWFSPPTASRLRSWSSLATSSPRGVRALALVALFRVVRELTRSFQGSNPTWVRRTSPDRPQVAIESEELDALLLKEQRDISKRLESHMRVGVRPIVVNSSAKALPIASDSIDLVLTSPPYLTRIDYAVAYARELAVLGTDILANRSLREHLMGTTLIRPVDARLGAIYGPTANQLVKAISEHQSKASRGYYLKQACQYLNDLVDSLDEISRVCKKGAVAIFVVQDSYYKDAPIRLADICEEEANLRGWTTTEKRPFEVSRTLTSLNKAAKLYPKGKVSETVLTLKRV
ncbi:hypothetical protein [Micromonospora vulcania]|uniref:site-specific DNA-methyltransferase (cytosine-N(4)-specific) n=1 Tax=Micromonospora vulcania TaxID=1441873 RepID=A0ABW1H0S2_9ACTN